MTRYTLQQSDINPDTVRVLVDANQLMCDVRPLPYPTWVGTVSRSTGKINVWMPTASTPRGYKRAARELLLQIAAEVSK